MVGVSNVNEGGDIAASRKGRGTNEIKQNVAAAQKGKGMTSLPYICRHLFDNIFVGRCALVHAVGSMVGSGSSAGEYILILGVH